MTKLQNMNKEDKQWQKRNAIIVLSKFEGFTFAFNDAPSCINLNF